LSTRSRHWPPYFGAATRSRSRPTLRRANPSEPSAWDLDGSSTRRATCRPCACRPHRQARRGAGTAATTAHVRVGSGASTARSGTDAAHSRNNSIRTRPTRSQTIPDSRSHASHGQNLAKAHKVESGQPRRDRRHASRIGSLHRRTSQGSQQPGHVRAHVRLTAAAALRNTAHHDILARSTSGQVKIRRVI
jgi:hypothetical protein